VCCALPCFSVPVDRRRRGVGGFNGLSDYAGLAGLSPSDAARTLGRQTCRELLATVAAYVSADSGLASQCGGKRNPVESPLNPPNAAARVSTRALRSKASAAHILCSGSFSDRTARGSLLHLRQLESTAGQNFAKGFAGRFLARSGLPRHVAVSLSVGVIHTWPRHRF